MKIFEITNKKIKSGKYGYYKCPKNIKIGFNGYYYEKEGEHLLYSAILQYISDKHRKAFKRINVSIYKNGDIVVCYDVDRKYTTQISYNINDFYLNNEKDILYLLEKSSDKLLLNRKLKIEKINKK